MAKRFKKKVDKKLFPLLHSLRFGCDRFTRTTEDERGESSQAPSSHVRSVGAFFPFLISLWLVLPAHF